MSEPISTATRPAQIDPLVPHDDENLLGALLLTNVHTALRDEALRDIAPEDFANPHLARLWSTARGLVDNGQRVTARALVLAAGTGTAAIERALRDLGTLIPAPADYPRAAAEVRRCSRLRAVVQAAAEMAERARHAEDADQALTWAMTRLGDLDQAHAAPEVREWSTLLDEWQNAITNPGDNHWIIPTPWDDINEVIAGGVHGGRMYVVGARPGEGKSIAAHRIAVHAASQGHPALVFSMEMGAMEVTGRMVAGAARIEMAEISRRQLSAHSYGQLTRWMPEARAWPLYVVDKPAVTVDYIKAVCRAQKRRTGLRVVAVDYLQLVNAADRRQPREQQVAEISRQLKQMSRELDIAVVVPAQLNRGPASRGGRAMLSDLRESGGIEADADVVMLLARGVVADGDRAGEFDGSLNIELAKNRHGPCRSLALAWHGGYASIG